MAPDVAVPNVALVTGFSVIGTRSTTNGIDDDEKDAGGEDGYQRVLQIELEHRAIDNQIGDETADTRAEYTKPNVDSVIYGRRATC